MWEAFSREEVVEVGREPETVPLAGVFMDAIYELDAGSGEVVWRWRARDHLIQNVSAELPDFAEPGASPGRIDVNAGQMGVTDWTHLNGIDHDPDTDLLVVSAHGLDELWVIDHGTSTEEAAGPAGDLLYRWGRPANWGGDGQPELYGQHDPTWLPGGRLMVFDNGMGRPQGAYSRVVQIEVPFEDGLPAAQTPDDAPLLPEWIWTAPIPSDLFAPLISGAQRLPGGNTLITEGPAGRLFEIDADGELVWEYVSPVLPGGIAEPGEVPGYGQNAVFKVRRYPADGPELDGLDLTPGADLMGDP